MKGYAVNANAILATITGNGLWPSMDLTFSLPNGWDTVKESDLMSMVGKKLYFTDSVMQPNLRFEKSDTAEWESYEHSGDYVQVDSITFNGYRQLYGTCSTHVYNSG